MQNANTEAVAKKAAPRYHFLLYLIIAVAICRLISFPWYPLMDTTEARYAEIARVMVETQDWVTPWFDLGVPFWGKPPLSFWITAVSFKIFGANEFAARLPHWLAGVVVIWLVWGWAGRRTPKLAIYASALLSGAGMFFLSAGAVMTDMVMLVGTTMAMRGFWLGLNGPLEERQHERWWLFLGLGIGLLAKGPIAVVLSLLPIFAWVVISRNFMFVWIGLPWIRGGLITLLIALPWYVLAEIRTPGFLDYFIIGEHLNRFLVPGWQGDLYGSAHKYPRGTIWLFLLIDLLPWILLLPGLFVFRLFRSDKVNQIQEDRPLQTYLWLWALTPAVFFTFAGNILWPYVLPGFPAMAMLAGMWLERDSKPQIVDRCLAIGLITTVVLFYAYIIDLRLSESDRLWSQKALIADYQSKKQLEEPLVYLGARKFSADFYSRRQVQFVPDVESLVRRIENSTGYVAIPNGMVPNLPPSLMISLQPISVHGRYTLYVVKNVAGK